MGLVKGETTIRIHNRATCSQQFEGRWVNSGLGRLRRPVLRSTIGGLAFDYRIRSQFRGGREGEKVPALCLGLTSEFLAQA